MRFSATTMVMAVMTVAAFMMGTALLSTREHQAGSVNTYSAVHFIAYTLFFSLFLSSCFSLLLFARLCGTFATVDTYRLRAAALHGVCMFAADRSILSIFSVLGTYTASLKVYTFRYIIYIGSCRSRMLYQAIVTRRHYRTTLDPPPRTCTISYHCCVYSTAVSATARHITTQYHEHIQIYILPIHY